VPASGSDVPTVAHAAEARSESTRSASACSKGLTRVHFSAQHEPVQTKKYTLDTP
jgi:hypothetical protein